MNIQGHTYKRKTLCVFTTPSTPSASSNPAGQSVDDLSAYMRVCKVHAELTEWADMAHSFGFY